MSRVVRAKIGPIHAKDLRLPTQLSLVEKDPLDWRCPRMGEQELLQFVKDVAGKRVFLAQQVEPFDKLGSVFPSLAFLETVSLEGRKEIGTCYEYCDQAIGRTSCGLPSFRSVKFIHREDWLKARDMIAAELIRSQEDPL